MRACFSPAVKASAEAMGLQWLTTSDHSCDLDETGDGTYGYATLYWEYTIQDQGGISTVYRDNVTLGSAWAALGSEVALLDSPVLDFRSPRGPPPQAGRRRQNKSRIRQRSALLDPDHLQAIQAAARLGLFVRMRPVNTEPQAHV